MVKIELIKDCTYHASSYVFDYKKSDTRIQEVPNKLAETLLKSDYFQEVKEEVENQSTANSES